MVLVHKEDLRRVNESTCECEKTFILRDCSTTLVDASEMLGYFKGALLVACLSSAGYYGYRTGMPAWYWEARLPDNVESLDVADL